MSQEQLSDVAGVTVLDLATARLDMPDLLAAHLGALVALDSARDSTGTVVHVAAGVEVAAPLQPFFGRNAERLAPDHRLLIVVEPGATLSYIEGCAAPIYTPHTKRRSIVELFVGEGATVRHTTIQNWSAHVIMNSTKSAAVAQNGRVEWIHAALGSAITNTHLSTSLDGVEASASVVSMLAASDGQRHDAIVESAHGAPGTTSSAVMKMLGGGGGSITHRHRVDMGPEDRDERAHLRSETLRIDDPLTVSDSVELPGAVRDRVVASAVERRVDDGQVDYLMRRGLSRSTSVAMIVLGYLEPIARTLPMEYRIEWERSIELDVAKALG